MRGKGEPIQRGNEPGGGNTTSPHSQHLKETWNFRPRRYPHLDDIVENKSTVFDYVSDGKKVSKHKFKPFIKHTTQSRRFSKYLEKQEQAEAGLPDDLTPINKPRPIKYAAHLDAQIFSFYRHLLAISYEEMLRERNISENVIAYRKVPLKSGRSKSTAHFAKDAIDQIIDRENCTAITIDISSFFDNLDHRFLKYKWKEIMGFQSMPDAHFHVYNNITKYSYVEQKALYQTLGFRNKYGRYIHCPFHLKRNHSKLCDSDTYRDKIINSPLVKKNATLTDDIPKGIPQGSPMSDVLANIYLIDFDCQMAKIALERNAFYRRYSDDILLICSHGDSIFFHDLICSLISQQGRNTLEVQPKKTTITNFFKEEDRIKFSGKPFVYLGFKFDGHSVLLKDASVSKFKRNSVQTVKKHVAIYAAKLKRGIKVTGVNQAILFHKTVNTDERLSKKADGSKKRSHQLDSNFVSYFRRAEKIFSTPKGKYNFKCPAVNRHKKFVRKRLAAELDRQTS